MGHFWKQGKQKNKKEDPSQTAVVKKYETVENFQVPLSEFLYSQVEEDECRLYAFIDSARNDEVFRYLLSCNVTYKSLVEGTPDVQAYGVSGFVVECIKDSPIYQWMTTEAWGNSCIVFFTSNSNFDELLAHFQQFNRVYLEDDDEVLFRFYDPRVLQAYLPTCARDELDVFFGDVISFYVEDHNPEILYGFKRGIKNDEYLLSISEKRMELN